MSILDEVHSTMMYSLETTFLTRLDVMKYKGRKAGQRPALGEFDNVDALGAGSSGGKGTVGFDLMKGNIYPDFSHLLLESVWNVAHYNSEYGSPASTADVAFETNEDDPAVHKAVMDGYEEGEEQAIMALKVAQLLGLVNEGVEGGWVATQAGEQWLEQNKDEVGISYEGKKHKGDYAEEPYDKDFKIGTGDDPDGLVGAGTAPKKDKKPEPRHQDDEELGLRREENEDADNENFAPTSVPYSSQQNDRQDLSEKEPEEDDPYDEGEDEFEEDGEEDMEEEPEDSKENTQGAVAQYAEETRSPIDADDLARTTPMTALRESKYTSKDMDSPSGTGSGGIQSEPKLPASKKTIASHRVAYDDSRDGSLAKEWEQFPSLDHMAQRESAQHRNVGPKPHKFKPANPTGVADLGY